ncbi:MAG: 3-methyl-2-oxobutanoate hydroxymethyltransferase, partial [Planctomycetota bacterium]
KILADAGVFSIVLEKVPASLAAQVTESVDVPVIGIGAGGGCDGQILVSHDMLGICTRFNPRFVRRYASLADEMQGAFERYAADVRSREFPNEFESY